MLPKVVSLLFIIAFLINLFMSSKIILLKGNPFYSFLMRILRTQAFFVSVFEILFTEPFSFHFYEYELEFLLISEYYPLNLISNFQIKSRVNKIYSVKKA
jgi:hypothetical protein